MAVKQEEKKQSIENLTLEEAFAELDRLLVQLSDRDVSLDESFLAYEKGTRLLKYCNEQLDMIEKKMLVLSEDGELHEFLGKDEAKGGKI